ncbi:MAG: SDR family NAD(P)-dependent oxidoreductase [Bacillota bacterium]
MQFKGKVSVITGGANGIGRQLALSLSKLGSKIAIIDIKQAEGDETAREVSKASECVFYHCDVKKLANIEATIKEIDRHFGGIDILANCAGLANRTPIEDITEEEWDLLNSVNLKASFFVSKEACKIMRRQGGGRIINFSSIRAYQADGNHTIYDVTKAGILAMTRSFAVAYAKDNINVNAVSPGYVLTPMSAHNLERKDFTKWLYGRVPAGRFIEIQEVVDTVLFLASEHASGITGQDILVDGGWQVHE